MGLSHRLAATKQRHATTSHSNIYPGRRAGGERVVRRRHAGSKNPAPFWKGSAAGGALFTRVSDERARGRRTGLGWSALASRSGTRKGRKEERGNRGNARGGAPAAGLQTSQGRSEPPEKIASACGKRCC